MVFEEAPNAFRVPISLVRSFTETSIMFISPTAAPKSVMRPITADTSVITPIISFKSASMASLLLILKSESSIGDNLLTERGISQKEFAELMGKRESEISKWLKGTHNFTLRTLAKISAVLDSPIIQVAAKQPNVYEQRNYSINLLLHTPDKSYSYIRTTDNYTGNYKIYPQPITMIYS